MNPCSKRLSALLTVAFALGSSAIGGAQTSRAVATSSPIESDRAAVAAIVMNAVSEVKLCGLAVEKTDDPDVRSLCRNASADNARTAIAGMQLAQRLGATGVKLQASPETSGLLDALSQYSGRDFDRAFLLAQIEHSENDENSIRYAVEVASDASVKHYEKAVLPNVENHLSVAEGVLRRLSEDTP